MLVFDGGGEVHNIAVVFRGFMCFFARLLLSQYYVEMSAIVNSIIEAFVANCNLYE